MVNEGDGGPKGGCEEGIKTGWTRTVPPKGMVTEGIVLIA